MRSLYTKEFLVISRIKSKEPHVVWGGVFNSSLDKDSKNNFNFETRLSAKLTLWNINIRECVCSLSRLLLSSHLCYIILFDIDEEDPWLTSAVPHDYYSNSVTLSCNELGDCDNSV